MKSIVLPAVVLTTTLCSCGSTGSSNLIGNLASGLQTVTGNNSDATTGASTGSSSSTGSTGNLLSGLLSSLLGGGSQLSTNSLAGTWNYTGTACVFESENLLLKAGGAVAANKITEQLDEALEKIGFQSGKTSFTFNTDGTYSAQLGGHAINGQYTLDADAQTIQLTYLAGLGKLTPHITLSGNNLKLLFESDKLLQLLQGVSALSGSTAGNTLSTLISSYDGLYIGLELQK